MQLNAVLTARVLAFVNIASLNPQGTIFFPSIVGKIVERFSFQKYPSALEDFDESKGIEFGTGNVGGVNVPRLTIYNNGFLIDTESSTDESDKILLNTLEWAKNEFGLTFSPSMISRRRYLSDLLFQTEAPILDNFQPLQNLRTALMDAMQTVRGERINYGTMRIDLDFERFDSQAPIARLTIQRRNDSAFSENRYFSEAPLPTKIHLELLERYEKDILKAQAGTTTSK